MAKKTDDKKGSAMSFVTGAAIGAATGVAAAVLLDPEKRQAISDKADEVKEMIAEKAEELKEQAQDTSKKLMPQPKKKA